MCLMGALPMGLSKQRFNKWLMGLLVPVLFLHASLGWTMWAKMSDGELVTRATLIVSAELLGKTLITTGDGQAYYLGVLSVSRVYKGDEDVTIVLLELPKKTGLRSSSDIFYEVGQAGLWLLQQQRVDSGIYMTTSPDSFWSIGQEQRLLKTINETK